MTTVVHSSPIAVSSARLLLGSIFVVHGLNGFLNFMPQAGSLAPNRALAFVAAIVITGYVFPLINAIEVVAGALLLSDRFVPLALALLAPIIINVLGFYVVLAELAPAGTILAATMLGLEIYLAWTYREAFRPMLAAHMNGETGGRRAT